MPHGYHMLLRNASLIMHVEHSGTTYIRIPWNASVMEQPLVSYLILSTMPLLSYQMNYPTLQFGCYGTVLWNGTSFLYDQNLKRE